MTFIPLGRRSPTALPETDENQIDTLQAHQSDVRSLFRAIPLPLIVGSLFAVALIVHLNLMAVLALLYLGIYAIVRGLQRNDPLPFVPGGVLTGAAVGCLLTSGPLQIASGEQAVSLFLVMVALGWLSIVPLSRRYTRCDMLWPVIPGTMMALTGLE